MPFLTNIPEEMAEAVDNTSSSTAGTLSHQSAVNRTDNSDVWTVKTLFPLAGSAPVLVASLFVFYFFRDCGKKKMNGGGGAPAVADKTSPKDSADSSTKGRLVIELMAVALLSLMFFLYVGLEMAFGNFLTVFSVKCKLG